ncbi:hypothetical protein [Streptomyces sp. NBC_01233]|uniref:hypothetical protein n=1 Tax=Streptomyces sp. NBC_01233 TaxID=2903787 RepID=UPI002E160D4A|nr:hypothetical protein OG332_24185 [Streptomyces sp. NBC_01233]
MSDTTEEQTGETEAPDTAEEARPFRVRDVFQFRRPATPETDEDTPADEAAPEAPPMPTEPPTIPAQSATTADGAGRSNAAHRVPHWWERDKDITAPSSCQHPNVRTFRLSTGEQVPFWCPDCKTEVTPDLPDRLAKPPAAASTGSIKWINGVPHHVPAPTCKHPDPEEVRSSVNGQLLAYWCTQCETKLDLPDDYDELQDVTKDDDADPENEGDQDGEDVDKVPPTIRQRWGQGIRGTGQKSYNRPVYGKDSTAKKKALIEVWGQMSGKTRHLLYNGTALGAGFYMGVPQFFTAEVAYLVDTYSSWTDFYVCVWYGVAAGIWVLDYRTRGWFPVFSWLTRIPTVSMIVGALLYGTPAA